MGKTSSDLRKIFSPSCFFSCRLVGGGMEKGNSALPSFLFVLHINTDIFPPPPSRHFPKYGWRKNRRPYSEKSFLFLFFLSGLLLALHQDGCARFPNRPRCPIHQLGRRNGIRQFSKCAYSPKFLFRSCFKVNLTF